MKLTLFGGMNQKLLRLKKYQPDTTQRTSCKLHNVVLNWGVYGLTQKRPTILIKYFICLNGKVDVINIGLISEAPTKN